MFQKSFISSLILVASLMLAACAMPMPKSVAPATSTPAPTLAPPTVNPMPAAKIPTKLQPLADKAADILAKELDVPADKVQILEIEAVQWSDASLGCPEPGMMYAQMITPGYRARARVNGQDYLVHMDEKGRGVSCSPDIAREPVGNK